MGRSLSQTFPLLPQRKVLTERKLEVKYENRAGSPGTLTLALELGDLGVQKGQRMCLGIYLCAVFPAWYMNL